MAPRKSEDGRVVCETVRFYTDVPEQARALAIYREMLANHPTAKTLGSLFPHVLTVLADVAREHPALNNQTARLVAKYQDQVMALLQALERGETVPGLDALVEQQATRSAPVKPKPQPPAASNGHGHTAADIDVDFGAFDA
jgi:hypothetical protein